MPEAWDLARPAVGSRGTVAERHPGMQVWEVPSISRGYRIFRGGIDGGMAAAIPDIEARRHTLTAYTDIHALGRDLGIDSFDTMHLFLVDCQRAILWRAEGEPAPTSFDELEAVVPASR